MVTYSDLFTFVIMLCAVITLVLTTLNHKKQRPCSGKVRRYFLSQCFPAARCALTNGSLVKYIICKSKLFVKLYVPGSVLGVLNNIIYLPGQPNRRQLSIRSESDRKEEMLMSTYEEFMIILATASLIVAILNLHHKKQPFCSLRKIRTAIS